MSDEIERIICRDIDQLPVLPEERWVPTPRPTRPVFGRVLPALALVAVVALALALGSALARIRSENAPTSGAEPGAAAAALACTGPGLTLAREYGPDAQLVATFASTVADTASSYHVTPDLASAAVRPLDPVAVCFYDSARGGFNAAIGPPRAERLQVVVWPNGRAQLIAAGQQANIPLVGPATGPVKAQTPPPGYTPPPSPRRFPALTPSQVLDGLARDTFVGPLPAGAAYGEPLWVPALYGTDRSEWLVPIMRDTAATGVVVVPQYADGTGSAGITTGWSGRFPHPLAADEAAAKVATPSDPAVVSHLVWATVDPRQGGPANEFLPFYEVKLSSGARWYVFNQGNAVEAARVDAVR